MGDKSVMLVTQAAELDHSFARNGWTPADIKWLSSGDVLTDILKLHYKVSGVEKFVIVPISEVRTIVSIDDDTDSPRYPSNCVEVIHSALVSGDPDEYDVVKMVTLWLHPIQMNDSIHGTDIYQYLKDNFLLGHCLSLRDALTIRKKGSIFFEKYFQNRCLFFWKSVYRDVNHNLYVPGLLVESGKVVIRWYQLNNSWGNGMPAMMFN